MRYFKIKIKSKSDKIETRKSLQSLIRKSSDEIFIFPFCLFNKKYYSHLKGKRMRPFEGKVTENQFEFSKRYYYGGGPNARSSRQIKLLGKIHESERNCLIDLEFHQNRKEFIIELILKYGLIVVYVINRNPLFIALPLFLFFEKFRITLIPLVKIKRRLNNFKV